MGARASVRIYSVYGIYIIYLDGKNDLKIVQLHDGLNNSAKLVWITGR